MPLLQACLNGAGTERVPVLAAEIASAAVEAVMAGASDLHVHPKTASGRDLVEPGHVSAVVDAVRAALVAAGRQEVAVGVTTGAWAEPDPVARLAAVASWTVLPDAASVNWHEEGAEALCALLLERGVAVEAGIWTIDAATAYAGSPLARRCRRTLVETTEQDLAVALGDAERVLEIVGSDGLPPVLLHGEGFCVWQVLDLAVARGLDTRIGLEDAELTPDGAPATDNTQLVRIAVARGAGRTTG